MLVYLAMITNNDIKKKKFEGFRALKPLEYIHMDASRVKLADDSIAWIHAIKDNYTKAILGLKISRTCDTKVAAQNLLEVAQEYDLENINNVKLITEGGNENKGEEQITLQEFIPERRTLNQF